MTERSGPSEPLAIAFHDAVIKYAITPGGVVSLKDISIAIIAVFGTYLATLPNGVRQATLEAHIVRLRDAVARYGAVTDQTDRNQTKN